MSSKTKILLITERRADYSRYKPLISLMKKDEKIDYKIIVTGLHLLKSHGYTLNEIKKDGFKVFKKINNFKIKKKNTSINMIHSMGVVFTNLSNILDKFKPDLVVTGFDIGANFALTVAAAHMNIPVAHIQGGEVTGSIDESLRHAMSKFANYHLVANKDAKKRLIKMGEIATNIFVVGCPSLDALRETEETSLNKMSQKFNFDFNERFVCLLQHPVTTEKNLSKNQILQTLKALKISGVNTFAIMPNNDAGYQEIINEIKFSKIKWTKNLSLSEYKCVLKNCSALIGNSSSGIHEAATYKIPVVNIGSRQNRRLKSKNIIDVKCNHKEIFKKINIALSSKFRKKLVNLKNPYGNGNSASKIIKILKNINLNKNTQKTITY